VGSPKHVPADEQHPYIQQPPADYSEMSSNMLQEIPNDSLMEHEEEEAKAPKEEEDIVKVEEDAPEELPE